MKTLLVNLMFCRLDKFDGPIFGGRREANIRGPGEGDYIPDVHWVKYLGDVYSGVGWGGGGVYTGTY